jgi:hypothetical protein
LIRQGRKPSLTAEQVAELKARIASGEKKAEVARGFRARDARRGRLRDTASLRSLEPAAVALSGKSGRAVLTARADCRTCFGFNFLYEHLSAAQVVSAVLVIDLLKECVFKVRKQCIRLLRANACIRL